jgi:hypothetical protein
VAIDQPSGKHAQVKRQTKARRFMGGRISFTFAKNKKNKKIKINKERKLGGR